MQEHPNRHRGHKRGICGFRFRLRNRASQMAVFWANCLHCTLAKSYMLLYSQPWIIVCPLCVECLLHALLAVSVSFVVPQITNTKSHKKPACVRAVGNVPKQITNQNRGTNLVEGGPEI